MARNKARVTYRGEEYRFGVHATENLRDEAYDEGLYKLAQSFGDEEPVHRYRTNCMTVERKAEIDLAHPTLQDLTDHHKAAGAAKRAQTQFRKGESRNPGKQGHRPSNGAGPSNAHDPPAMEDEPMDGELADDEESDWDDLHSEDMGSDTSDDMQGVDPVDPNPAYQDWPPKDAQGRPNFDFQRPMSPFDISEGDLEPPEDKNEMQLAYEEAMLSPRFREFEERKHDPKKTTQPNICLGLNRTPPSAEEIARAWAYFLPHQPQPDGPPPRKTVRKPFNEAKAVAHMWPIKEQEWTLSSEEDVCEPTSELPGGLRYQYQVDRKAWAEGCPQDATPEVPLEGWAFPLNGPHSDAAIQEVESALRARGNQLEKRFEEEMTALKALLSDPEFQASQSIE